MTAEPDRDVWIACFGAAIAGVLAAHSRLPNPELVAKYCATLADVAAKEAHSRFRPAKPPRGTTASTKKP